MERAHPGAPGRPGDGEAGGEGARPAAPAWRVAAFAAMAMTMTVFGQTPGVSVFVDPIAHDLRLSRPEISTVYSVATLVAAIFMSRVGRRIDQHGVRRATLVIAVAFGLAILGLALAQGLAWLALGFLGIRLLGQGALSLAARTILAIRFRATLGRVVGITGVLAAIGVSLGPLALAGLIDALGWRETLVLGGVSVWLVVIPLTLWWLRPGDDRRAVVPGDAAGDMEGWTREAALRTPMFWLLTLSGASVAGILTGLTFHQVSILGEVGLSAGQAAANFVPQTAPRWSPWASSGPSRTASRDGGSWLPRWGCWRSAWPS